MYIGDCVEGLIRIMACNYHDAVNLGTDELVTIDELVDIVCQIAGKKLSKRYNPKGPQGVRGRNSDNTLLRKVLGWEPCIRLQAGMAHTYPWICEQVQGSRRAERALAQAAEVV
jgi:nucleoside-diphosphate-sugar epimerase